MNNQQLLIMVGVGIVAGWLASFVVGGLRWGLLGYLIAGVLGSFVGGFVLSKAGVRIGVGNPLVDNVITSTIGAIIVIVVARVLS